MSHGCDFNGSCGKLICYYTLEGPHVLEHRDFAGLLPCGVDCLHLSESASAQRAGRLVCEVFAR